MAGSGDPGGTGSLSGTGSSGPDRMTGGTLATVSAVLLLPVLIFPLSWFFPMYGWLTGLIVPILIVGLLFVLVGNLSGTSRETAASALGSGDQFEQLKIQYASGELTEEAFKRQVELLGESESVGTSFGHLDDEFTSQTHAPGEPFEQFTTQATETFETTAGESAKTADETPEERLRRRYADGDVSEAEFRQRLAVLRETEPSRY